MPRDTREQSSFRDALFNEHYKQFMGHGIFCHATLAGYWNQYPFVQKVEAHHICDWATHKHEPWVMHVSNGILISREIHVDIHAEFRRGHREEPLEHVTARLISASFENLYFKYRRTKLRGGYRFVDLWEELLVSKQIIT